MIRNITGFAVCAAGAVAIAAGAHFFLKRGRKRSRKEIVEGTPVDEEPVQRASSGGLHSSAECEDSQMDRATPERCLYEAEKKDVEREKVSSVQLSTEEVCELKEFEQERLDHMLLKEKYKEMMLNEQNNERLQVQENTMLKKQVNALQGQVQTLEGELLEAQKLCDELLKEQVQKSCKGTQSHAQNIMEFEQERLDHMLLKEKYKEMMLNEQNNERLQVQENTMLKKQVNALQGQVQTLEGELLEAQKLCDELLKEQVQKSCKGTQSHAQNIMEFEQERLDHMLLKEKHKEMMLNEQHEERLQVQENTMLKKQVNSLQGQVQTLEGQLLEAQKLCDELLKEHVQKSYKGTQSHAQNIMKQEKEQRCLKDTQSHAQNTVDQTLQHNYNVLWTQYEITLESLAEAKEAVDVAVERNRELEHINSVLKEQVKTLQEKVVMLEGKLLSDHKTRVKLFKSTLVQENANLKEQVKSLQDLVKTLEKKLQDAHCTNEENLKERESHLTEPNGEINENIGHPQN